MTLFHDRQGGFAVWFGLAAIPLLSVVGLAVDFSRLTNLKSGLQDAADSAALAAVSIPSLAMTELAADKRNLMATKVFQENSKNLGISGIVAKPKSELVSGKVKVSVDFQVDAHLFFANFLPGPYAKVSGVSVASTAKSGQGLYNEIYFLIDNSASMGIGQTASDSMKMVNDVGIKAYSLARYGDETNVLPCAVACHEAQKDSYTYYKSKKNYKMRIDTVIGSLDAFINSLQSAGLDKYTRISLNTTDDTYSSKAGTFETSLSDARNNVKKIGLSSSYTTTNMTAAILNLKAKLNKSGDGSSAQKPIVRVVILTDGVEHFSTSDSLAKVNKTALVDPVFPDTNIMQVMDQSGCTSLKNTGADVFTLNVKYRIPYYWFDPAPQKVVLWKDTGWLDQMGRVENLEKLIPQVPAALQACASSKANALSADTQAEFTKAFGSLFDSVYKVTEKPILID